ncbi:MAG: alpha/beta hydrolase fold domain-containing protein [Lentilitoribacter sp.]
MISKQAQIAKGQLQKEVINPAVSLEEQRADWNKYASMQALADGVSAQEEVIAGVECLWLLPENIIDEKLLIYAHGGGLVVGSIITHRTFVSHLSKYIGRKILMVGYGLLPENDFSKPMLDISAVYRELLTKRNYDPQHIYFAGDSSGGGACLSSLINLRTENSALPKGFIAISGAFDASLQGQTMQSKNDSDPVLSFDVLHHWQKQYFKGKIALDHPYVSPMFSKLGGLPEMLLIVGGDEVWLDDSIRVADKVRAAAGLAALIIFDQMWHVFVLDTQLPESILAMEHIKTFLDNGSPTH